MSIEQIRLVTGFPSSNLFHLLSSGIHTLRRRPFGVYISLMLQILLAMQNGFANLVRMG
jgi:hypothetical protein